MRNTDKKNTLQHQLKRLLEASEAGDFGVTLFDEGLSTEEAEAINYINKTRDNYIKAMGNELNKALSETRSASNAKSEFLANMSHEMRTPLNAIIGLTGLCLENSTLDEEINSNLEKIYKAGTTLLEMVNDILEISQVEELDSVKSFDERNGKYVKPERVSLPYARVLVVDDNLTNLDVAKGLMKPYKMQIDCVDSGQKAIDAMRCGQNRYDAIFMDQMMPGMDGLVAAQRIRELGSDYAANVPIIALTANAVSGSEEMFLSNGFQAFIPKPIDITRLDKVINRFIRDDEKGALYEGPEEPEQDSATSESSFPLLGRVIKGLNIVKGIKQFNGETGSYLKVLRSYAINTHVLLDSLRSFDKERIHDYEIVVHGIKGSSASICAEELAVMAKALENAAKENDISHITENNQAFINAAQSLIIDLDALFAEMDSENPKPQKDKPDIFLLAKLKNACDDYEMDGVDFAMDEIMEYSYTSDDGLVKWLQENIEQMNFSEIVEKLSSVLTDGI